MNSTTDTTKNDDTESAPVIGRPDYEARRENRIVRLQERAVKTKQEASAKFARAHEIGSHIPFGQPILVGHHSERRARRDAEKIQSNMRQGCALMDKAEKQQWAAEGAESNMAISSDNPEALTLLKEKLAGLEANHQRLVDVRKAFQMLQRGTLDKNKTISEEIKAVVRAFVPTGEYFGSEPVMAYELTNSSASIRAIKKRIVELEKMAAMSRDDLQIGDIKIIDNKDINRVQIVFPGKPDDATRANLKARGFVWSPSEGAWQRLRSPGCFDLAVWLLEKA